MASYIKTLKEDNGDITYPQTLGSAVLLTGGADLETELGKFVTAENIASTSALTPPVQTAMIADGAVTAAKINSGLLSDIGSYSNSEIETPFTWTNGAKLYKKTLPIVSCGHDGATVTVPINAGGNVDVVKIEGVIISASSNQAWPLPFYWDGSTRGIIRVDKTNVYVNVWAASGTVYDSPAYVTIYYTKSS